MDKYRKTDGNKYYLKKLNSITNKVEWIEIKLEHSTESDLQLEEHEVIVNKPQHNYYFTHDAERPKDE